MLHIGLHFFRCVPVRVDRNKNNLRIAAGVAEFFHHQFHLRQGGRTDIRAGDVSKEKQDDPAFWSLRRNSVPSALVNPKSAAGGYGSAYNVPRKEGGLANRRESAAAATTTIQNSPAYPSQLFIHGLPVVICQKNPPPHRRRRRFIQR